MGRVHQVIQAQLILQTLACVSKQAGTTAALVPRRLLPQRDITLVSVLRLMSEVIRTSLFIRGGGAAHTHTRACTAEGGRVCRHEPPDALAVGSSLKGCCFLICKLVHVHVHALPPPTTRLGRWVWCWSSSRTTFVCGPSSSSGWMFQLFAVFSSSLVKRWFCLRAAEKLQLRG